MIMTQGDFEQVKGHWKKVHNFCLVFIFLMEKHRTFLLHRKIAYDLSVCQELDPGSVVEVQGHCFKKNASFLSRPYLVIL